MGVNGVVGDVEHVGDCGKRLLRLAVGWQRTSTTPEVEMSWGVLLAIAFGALCVALAFLVRAGRNRSFYPVYQTDAPPWVRNRVFVLLPFGVALIAGGAAATFSNGDNGTGRGVTTLITIVAGALSIVWMFRPPEFMKPRWLRDVESGSAPAPALPGGQGAPGPGGRRRMYLPPVAYWGLWGLTVVVFTLWVVLGWPWSVLVGIGAAISTLAASTPRKDRTG
jgi:hypothetical protein